MGATRTVLQFKIQLRHIEPPIWRRIVVPAEYSFWDLHVAIQDAMGWLDCHLHAFRLRHPDGEITLIGMPDPDPFEGDPLYLAGWQVRVAPFFIDVGDRAEYEYDFGDGWEHDVVLEQVSPRVAKAKYPQCLAGERACPPEDCGGPRGYNELLTHALDPTDPDAEEWREQLGPDFDPESFAPRSVKFDNPKRRWKRAFGED